MTLGQVIIIFMSLLVFVPFILQAIDEMVTERKERIYKIARNNAIWMLKKQARLQKDAEDRMKFLMELR